MKKLTASTFTPAVVALCALVLSGCGQDTEGSSGPERNPFQQTGEPEPFEPSDPSTSPSETASASPEASASASTEPPSSSPTAEPTDASSSGATEAPSSSPSSLLGEDVPLPTTRVKSVKLAALPAQVSGYSGKFSHNRIMDQDLFAYTRGKVSIVVSGPDSLETYGWRAGALKHETKELSAGRCGKSWETAALQTCYVVSQDGVFSLLTYKYDMTVPQAAEFAEAFIKAVGTA